MHTGAAVPRGTSCNASQLERATNLARAQRREVHGERLAVAESARFADRPPNSNNEPLERGRGAGPADAMRKPPAERSAATSSTSERYGS
jgi:hypothetical protein